MKFRLVEEIDKYALEEVIRWAEDNKYYDIDLENHKIVVPLPVYFSTRPDYFKEEGMMGDWLEKNGFNVSYNFGDFEYLTKGHWVNRYRGVVGSGKKSYLRNRLIVTVTW